MYYARNATQRNATQRNATQTFYMTSSIAASLNSFNLNSVVVG